MRQDLQAVIDAFKADHPEVQEPRAVHGMCHHYSALFLHYLEEAGIEGELVSWRIEAFGPDPYKDPDFHITSGPDIPDDIRELYECDTFDPWWAYAGHTAVRSHGYFIDFTARQFQAGRPSPTIFT